jgi:NitT/TauT family transport system substrate-binding protein
MRLFRLLAALALATLCVPCLPAQAQEPVNIRMSHPPLAFHVLPLLVASEKGYFAAEGLKVSHSFTTGGSEAATALIAGNVDVLNSALTQPVNLRSKNAPIKIIAGVAGIRDWGVVVDKKRHANVKRLADLKGMRIATPRRGSDADQIIRYLLEGEGFNLDRDVQLIQIGGYQNHLIALEKGDVDASILPEPFFTSGVQEGATQAVFDLLKGDGPDILRQRMFTGLVVTDDFLKKRHDVAEKVVRATKKAVDAIYSDPATGIAVAQIHFRSVKPDVLKAIYDRLASAAKGRAYETRLLPEAINAENEFLIKFGVVKSPVAYDDTVAKDMAKVW